MNQASSGSSGTAFAGFDLLSDAQRQGDPARFRQLADCWKRDTEFCSSLVEMAVHPAYQQIIGMGRAAIPLLLNELQHEPDHWFWALSAITGEDPVSQQSRGSVPKMTEDWLRWGRDNGWI